MKNARICNKILNETGGNDGLELFLSQGFGMEAGSWKKESASKVFQVSPGI